jgi:hypothetical protein
MVDTLADVGAPPKGCALTISSYPNPFNPSTTIRYTVPREGPTRVDIHDARGTLVATLVDGVREAGAYTRAWNGRDAAGRAGVSGIDFARVDHPPSPGPAGWS